MTEVELPWTKKPSRPTRRKGGRGPSADDASETRVDPAAPADAPPQSPLDFTLAVMRDPLKPDALRASLAKAALPYVHGRWCPLGSDPRDAKEKVSPPFEVLVPGAAQRETVRRRTGTIPDTVAETVPDQHSSTRNQAGADCVNLSAVCCSASGTSDISAQLAGAEERACEMEQRAIAAEARMRESEQRAVAAESRVADLEEQESAALAMLARVKTQWPDIFDAAGAVRAPAADERDRLAQLVTAQERARDLEERAIMAEGALREAQFRARDMEQRACAAEELIAWRR